MPVHGMHGFGTTESAPSPARQRRMFAEGFAQQLFLRDSSLGFQVVFDLAGDFYDEMMRRRDGEAGKERLSSNSWEFIEAAVSDVTVGDGKKSVKKFKIEARGATVYVVSRLPGDDKIVDGAIGDFYGHFPPDDQDEQGLTLVEFDIRSTP